VALVLCTGVDKVLLETRRLILERAGHKVIPATNHREVAAACKEHQFDVAVMGQSVSPHSKREIASLIRRHCPSAKVLELYQSHQGKSVADADSWLEVPTGVPQELAEHVTRMVGGGK
jgi:CheY-like chemotaxis protein